MLKIKYLFVLFAIIYSGKSFPQCDPSVSPCPLEDISIGYDSNNDGLNEYTSGTYKYFLNNITNKITKPIIVAEGWDPLSLYRVNPYLV